MKFQKSQNARRARRAGRVRAKITGTAEKPRLSVFRSLRSTSAQLIDDVTGKTLAAASTREIKGKMKKTDAATQAGTLLAERAAKAGVKTAVFDRSFYKFHGRIKALAEAARKAGLAF